MPVVCAHAGCEGTPRDSLESVVAGIAAGADVVEIDLRFGPKGQPVLSHDPVGAGEEGRKVRLESVLDLLALHPQVALNLDLKEPHCALLLHQFLTTLRPRNRLYCTGLSHSQTSAFRAACPGIDHASNTVPWYYHLSSGPRKPRALGRLRERGVMALNLDHHAVTPRIVETARRAGLQIHAWTVDNEEVARRMLALGVDSITTNRVAALRKLLS